METRDMAEVMETFRTKFMEDVAGIADRVAGVCSGLVANPGSMAPHDMEPEMAWLVGGVLDGLSAAAVTVGGGCGTSRATARRTSSSIATARRSSSSIVG